MNRTCCYVFLIIGVLLLGLALALNIEFDAGPTQAQQMQRAHVVRAVSQLENGCVTCHASVNANPANARIYALVALSDTNQNHQSPIFKTRTATAPLSQNQLHTQLIETGQRILQLPNGQDQRVEAVIADYLQVYAQARADQSAQTTQLALWQLDEIENLLRGLENQASPYQLTRQENQPTQVNLVAFTLATAPHVAMVAHDVSIGNVVPVIVTQLDSASHVMPFEVIYATHRRGPPARAYLDSAL